MSGMRLGKETWLRIRECSEKIARKPNMTWSGEFEYFEMEGLRNVVVIAKDQHILKKLLPLIILSGSKMP